MAASPRPSFWIRPTFCSSSTNWILQNGHQSAERKNTSMAPLGPMMDLRVWFRPSWSGAEKAGTCWPTSGPVLMLWPCNTVSGSAQIVIATKDLNAMQTARHSEREHVFFGDHDHRRPARRYLCRIGQCRLASDRRCALLKRLDGR